jgi:hypothetical protein
MGMQNAAVFPDPVSAHPSTSLEFQEKCQYSMGKQCWDLGNARRTSSAADDGNRLRW